MCTNKVVHARKKRSDECQRAELFALRLRTYTLLSVVCVPPRIRFCSIRPNRRVALGRASQAFEVGCVYPHHGSEVRAVLPMRFSLSPKCSFARPISSYQLANFFRLRTKVSEHPVLYGYRWCQVRLETSRATITLRYL